MKNLFLSFLLCFPFMGVAQKQVVLTLKSDLPRQTAVPYRITKVMDLRSDTSSIGLVQTGLFNKEAVANLKNGAALEISKYLHRTFPISLHADTLILNIRQLVISENTTFSSEIATLTYHYEVLLRRDNSLHKILETKDTLHEVSMEVTGLHERNIRASLQKTMTRLSKVDVEQFLQNASAPASPTLDSLSAAARYYPKLQPGTPSQPLNQSNDFILGMYLTMPMDFPFIDRKDLNQRLLAAGLPTAKHAPGSAGVGLQILSDRVITTFAFSKWTLENTQDTYMTEVEYRSMSINVGYDLLKKAQVSLYPYAGFKGTGFSYLYREKLPADTPFEDYLNTALAYKEFNNSRGHLDLGLGFSFQSFYLVNFRAGYLLPLEKVRWHMNNSQDEMRHGPNISYPFYINLTLGIGTLIDNH